MIMLPPPALVAIGIVATAVAQVLLKQAAPHETVSYTHLDVYKRQALLRLAMTR